jgi:hypothetical protein
VICLSCGSKIGHPILFPANNEYKCAEMKIRNKKGDRKELGN